MEAQTFQDKLAGVSPQGQGIGKGREGEREMEDWPPQTPGTPVQIINEQQKACGYMFFVELDLISRPQFNGKYSLKEVSV